VGTTDLVLWLLVSVWLIAVPIRATVGAEQRQRRLANADAAVRRTETLRTIAIQWTAAIVLGVAWFASGRGWDGLRLPGVPETPLQWGVTAASLLLLAWLARGWRRAERSAEAREVVREQVAPALLGLAPRTEAEHRRFAMLSVTAGVCEEFIYRGVALALLAEPSGLPAAVLVTTAAFGSSHAYQGVGGVVRTSIAGLVFAGMVIGSGSLLLAMAVHAMVDVLQGRLLGAVVTEAE